MGNLGCENFKIRVNLKSNILCHYKRVKQTKQSTPIRHSDATSSPKNLRKIFLDSSLSYESSE